MHSTYCKPKVTREYIQNNKEEILDLIQHLADVLRFADRKPDAPNADYFVSYLNMAKSIWYRLF